MVWGNLKKGRYSQANGEYFITFNSQNKFPFFLEFNLAHLFCAQIARNEAKFGCIWLTWVLMPDHFHGLLRLGLQFSLSEVIASLKGASAHSINLYLQRNGQVWQPSFYDHALRQEEDRKSIARYIIANPLRRGLVKKVENYSFWNSVYLDE